MPLVLVEDEAAAKVAVALSSVVSSSAAAVVSLSLSPCSSLLPGSPLLLCHPLPPRVPSPKFLLHRLSRHRRLCRIFFSRLLCCCLLLCCRRFYCR
eukprot:4979608-Pleurochrysis_carterae.AAC.1